MKIKFKDKFPETDESVFVAENATVIGDVKIGKNSSVWFNAVIRGDVNYIRIGTNTNIQDGSILHVSGDNNYLEIGNDVTIGHGAIVHGCRIGSNVLIGMGSIILDGAVINDNSIIAAGALIRERAEIPEGVLAAGVPAKIIREITEEEKIRITESAEGYAELANQYLKKK